jgi:hypothetical protein
MLSSWEVEAISKQALCRAISTLFQLLSHSDPTIRFLADQTLDALFRVFYPYFFEIEG